MDDTFTMLPRVAFTQDEREAGQAPVHSNEEWMAAGFIPVLVEVVVGEPTVVADLAGGERVDVRELVQVEVHHAQTGGVVHYLPAMQCLVA